VAFYDLFFINLRNLWIVYSDFLFFGILRPSCKQGETAGAVIEKICALCAEHGRCEI